MSKRAANDPALEALGLSELQDQAEGFSRMAADLRDEVDRLGAAIRLAVAHLQYHHIDRMSRDEVASLLERALNGSGGPEQG